MNLNKLHLLMIGHKYHYIEGYSISQCLNLVFSKGYNGRGDSISTNIELLRDNCTVVISKQNDAPNPQTVVEIKDVTFNEMIAFIKMHL